LQFCKNVHHHRADADREPAAPVRLAEAAARARLASADHGTLCTIHADRGVDAVPVVYALADDHVAVPIDRVKPKTGGRLQRERNLVADPRATLLIEHWDRDDWAKLWWVRAELRWQADASGQPTEVLAAQLADRFAQYDEQPFARLLVFEIVAVTGWAASD
jgi:hypothetical protein